MNLPYEELCSQADEETWRKHRWDGISATMCVDLMGEIYKPKDEKRTQSELIADRIMRFANRTDDFKDSPQAQYGRLFERHWLDRAEKYEKVWADSGEMTTDEIKIYSWGKLCRSKRWPFLLATPDGYMDSDKGRTIVECKTMGDWSAKSFKPGAPIPKRYMVQVQTQLAVTGLEHGYLLQCNFGIYPTFWPIERDEQMISEIIEKAEEAWLWIQQIRSQS